MNITRHVYLSGLDIPACIGEAEERARGNSKWGREQAVTVLHYHPYNQQCKYRSFTLAIPMEVPEIDTSHLLVSPKTIERETSP